MNQSFRELAEQLADCFAPLNEVIAAAILAGMCADEGFGSSYRFEIAPETLRQLTSVLALHETLALDFRDAVWANRRSAYGLALVQHALTVGRYLVRRERLEAALPQVLAPALRQRFAKYLNEVDGDLALQRDGFAHSELARRINQAAGALIVDGLQLHGLVHVLASDAYVWDAFRALLAQAPQTADALVSTPEQQKE